MPAPPALPSRSVGVSPPKPRTATRPPAAAPVELATPVREVPVRELPVREAPKTKVVVTATTKTSLLSHEAGTKERETLLGPVGKSIMPEVTGVLVAAQRPPERVIETPNRGDVASGLPPVPNLPPMFSSTAAPPAESSSRGQLDSLSNERTHFNVSEEPTRRSSALPASRGEDDTSTNEKSSPAASLPLSRRLRAHPLVWFAAGCACTLLLVMMTQGNSAEPNTAVAAPAQSAAVVAAELAPPSAPTQPLALAVPSPPAARDGEVDVSTGATEAEVEEAPEVAKAEVHEQENPRPRAAKARVYKARSPKSSAKRKKSFVPSGL